MSGQAQQVPFRRRWSTVGQLAALRTRWSRGEFASLPCPEAAAASLDDISTALLDAALGATREMLVTTACSGCGKKQRVEVEIRTFGRGSLRSSFCFARASGVRLRPKSAISSPSSHRRGRREAQLGRHADDLRDHFASEIAAVTEDGDAMLRERVAVLDDDQRLLLREALDEVKIAS